MTCSWVNWSERELQMTVCSTVVGLDPLASLVGPGVRRAMIAANRVVGRSWVVAAAAGDGLGRQVDLASVRLDNLMRYVLPTALHRLTFPLVEDGTATFAGARSAPFTPLLRPCVGKVVMKNPGPNPAQRPGHHPPRLALHLTVEISPVVFEFAELEGLNSLKLSQVWEKGGVAIDLRKIVGGAVWELVMHVNKCDSVLSVFGRPAFQRASFDSLYEA
jgi:hypothetical protein